MLNKIISFSVKNKLIIGLFVLALIGWGTFEVTRLPIDAVPPGQLVKCYSTSKTGEQYAASIHLITRNVDENGSGEVHCHFEKYDRRLVPGMFMNAEIELQNANVTAVPDDAVVKWENKHYIFVSAGNDKFIMTPVETGTSNGGFTEIKTNIGNKEIVIRNAYTLLMKMKNGGEEG